MDLQSKEQMNKNRHTHGFKTPDDYFDQFEDVLLDQIKLEEHSKETGFGVPDGYFDDVEVSLFRKLEVEQATTGVVPLFSKKTWTYALAIAASLALLITLALPGIKGATDAEELPLADIENYLQEDKLDWDSYDVAAMMTDEELNSLSMESDLFNDENLENYLLENIDDTSLLIE